MKSIFFLLFIFSICISSYSQFSYDFVIKSEEDIVVNGCIEDLYGNNFLCGIIGDSYSKKYDGFLIKIFPNGMFNTFRIQKNDTVVRLNELVSLDNNTIMVLGGLGSDSTTWYTPFLYSCIIDSGLNIISENSFRIDNMISTIGITRSIVDRDNNIIVGGEAYYYPNPQSDLFFVRLNQQGDSLFVKLHQIPSGQILAGLTENPNLLGYSFIGKGLGYFSVTHYTTLDSEFNIITTNDFEIELGQPSMGYWLSDSKFLCSGTNEYEKVQKDDEYICAMIVDTNGLIQKDLVLDKPGIDDYAAWKYSNSYVNDTTIYIGGFTNPGLWVTYPNLIDLYLIDANLNLLGYKEFSGDEHYNLMGIKSTSDGGCLLYAELYDNPSGYQERDLRVIKVLRNDIHLVTSLESMLATHSFTTVWPNPADHELNVSIGQLSNQKEIHFQIFNGSGKKITDRKISGVGNVIKIEISNLQSGIYFLKMMSSETDKICSKFIKK